ncbi:MANSC domain-containing protein [Nephila pilipes]|uniref:MANSC domain-containing protein n=1 Tax=Nephila pilipes TaxID=299642 RepID=A0A8X6IML8_NEPPI|nr:MANSC domain-containing protein [Nephila pilipes]GFU39725.1 MANSC domain-containing protein [Nephila pilipes]
MTRYLLLILLFSWSSLVSYSHECETGVAFVDSILSVQRSLMANADVALLKSFVAPTVKTCMEECCSGKYGSCSVASFKKNTTKENCLHFYCRPLTKCKFLSSLSTDSFSFSSNPLPALSVSSNQASTTSLPKHASQDKIIQPSHTKEEIATFSNEQFALKNDNTSVKPRKGVHDLTQEDFVAKSGIKPRKGVTLDDVPHSKFLLTSSNKSNVKPRKGVEPYSSGTASTSPSTTEHVETKGASSLSSIIHHTTVSSIINHNSTDDLTSDDLLSALQKVFEDDTTTIESTTSSKISPTSTRISPEVTATHSHSSIHSTTIGRYTIKPETTLYSSYNSQTSLDSIQNSQETSSSKTPTMETSFFPKPDFNPPAEFTVSTTVSSSTTYFLTIAKTRQPPAMQQPLVVEDTKEEEKDDRVTEELRFSEELSTSDEEAENDRKYKSSIHLVLSLVFGLLVLFAVLGVVAKRVYDGWLRRDYYRMNYLIDGIYNGVD